MCTARIDGELLVHLAQCVQADNPLHECSYSQCPEDSKTGFLREGQRLVSRAEVDSKFSTDSSLSNRTTPTGTPPLAPNIASTE